jgi:hypothetical protein
MTTAAFPAVDGSQPCAAEDPEVFFPNSRDSYWKIPRALAACEACALRRECLAYALTHRVLGVWGGTTHSARERLRDEHGIEAEPVELSDTDTRRDLTAVLDRGGASAADVALAVGVTPRTVQRHRARRSTS